MNPATQNTKTRAFQSTVMAGLILLFACLWNAGAYWLTISKLSDIDEVGIRMIASSRVGLLQSIHQMGFAFIIGYVWEARFFQARMMSLVGASLVPVVFLLIMSFWIEKIDLASNTNFGAQSMNAILVIAYAAVGFLGAIVARLVAKMHSAFL